MSTSNNMINPTASVTPVTAPKDNKDEEQPPPVSSQVLSSSNAVVSQQASQASKTANSLGNSASLAKPGPLAAPLSNSKGAQPNSSIIQPQSSIGGKSSSSLGVNQAPIAGVVKRSNRQKALLNRSQISMSTTTPATDKQQSEPISGKPTASTCVNPVKEGNTTSAGEQLASKLEIDERKSLEPTKNTQLISKISNQSKATDPNNQILKASEAGKTQSAQETIVNAANSEDVNLGGKKQRSQKQDKTSANTAVQAQAAIKKVNHSQQNTEKAAQGGQPLAVAAVTSTQAKNIKEQAQSSPPKQQNSSGSIETKLTQQQQDSQQVCQKVANTSIPAQTKQQAPSSTKDKEGQKSVTGKRTQSQAKQDLAKATSQVQNVSQKQGEQQKTQKQKSGQTAHQQLTAATKAATINTDLNQSTGQQQTALEKKTGHTRQSTSQATQNNASVNQMVDEGNQVQQVQEGVLPNKNQSKPANKQGNELEASENVKSNQTQIAAANPLPTQTTTVQQEASKGGYKRQKKDPKLQTTVPTAPIQNSKTPAHLCSEPALNAIPPANSNLAQNLQAKKKKQSQNQQQPVQNNANQASQGKVVQNVAQLQNTNELQNQNKTPNKQSHKLNNAYGSKTTTPEVSNGQNNNTVAGGVMRQSTGIEINAGQQQILASMARGLDQQIAGNNLGTVNNVDANSQAETREEDLEDDQAMINFIQLILKSHKNENQIAANQNGASSSAHEQILLNPEGINNGDGEHSMAGAVESSSGKHNKKQKLNKNSNTKQPQLSSTGVIGKKDMNSKRNSKAAQKKAISQMQQSPPQSSQNPNNLTPNQEEDQNMADQHQQAAFQQQQQQMMSAFEDPEFQLQLYQQQLETGSQQQQQEQNFALYQRMYETNQLSQEHYEQLVLAHHQQQQAQEQHQQFTDEQYGVNPLASQAALQHFIMEQNQNHPNQNQQQSQEIVTDAHAIEFYQQQYHETTAHIRLLSEVMDMLNKYYHLSSALQYDDQAKLNQAQQAQLKADSSKKKKKTKSKRGDEETQNDQDNQNLEGVDQEQAIEFVFTEAQREEAEETLSGIQAQLIEHQVLDSDNNWLVRMDDLHERLQWHKEQAEAVYLRLENLQNPSQEADQMKLMLTKLLQTNPNAQSSNTDAQGNQIMGPNGAAGEDDKACANKNDQLSLEQFIGQYIDLEDAGNAEKLNDPALNQFLIEKLDQMGFDAEQTIRQEPRTYEFLRLIYLVHILHQKNNNPNPNEEDGNGLSQEDAASQHQQQLQEKELVLQNIMASLFNNGHLPLPQHAQNQNQNPGSNPHSNHSGPNNANTAQTQQQQEQLDQHNHENQNTMQEQYAELLLRLGHLGQFDQETNTAALLQALSQHHNNAQNQQTQSSQNIQQEQQQQHQQLQSFQQFGGQQQQYAMMEQQPITEEEFQAFAPVVLADRTQVTICRYIADQQHQISLHQELIARARQDQLVADAQQMHGYQQQQLLVAQAQAQAVAQQVNADQIQMQQQTEQDERRQESDQQSEKDQEENQEDSNSHSAPAEVGEDVPMQEMMEEQHSQQDEGSQQRKESDQGEELKSEHDKEQSEDQVQEKDDSKSESNSQKEADPKEVDIEVEELQMLDSPRSPDVKIKTDNQSDSDCDSNKERDAANQSGSAAQGSNSNEKCVLDGMRASTDKQIEKCRDLLLQTNERKNEILLSSASARHNNYSNVNQLSNSAAGVMASGGSRNFNASACSQSAFQLLANPSTNPNNNNAQVNQNPMLYQLQQNGNQTQHQYQPQVSLRFLNYQSRHMVGQQTNTQQEVSQFEVTPQEINSSSNLGEQQVDLTNQREQHATSIQQIAGDFEIRPVTHSSILAVQAEGEEEQPDQRAVELDGEGDNNYQDEEDNQDSKELSSKQSGVKQPEDDIIDAAENDSEDPFQIACEEHVEQEDDVEQEDVEMDVQEKEGSYSAEQKEADSQCEASDNNKQD